jgi:hypothetical protein
MRLIAQDKGGRSIVYQSNQIPFYMIMRTGEEGEIRKKKISAGQNGLNSQKKCGV